MHAPEKSRAPAGWSRSPKFMLRLDAMEQMLAGRPQGRFLEVGAGSGELCAHLLERGYSGWVYDLGDATRAGLRARFAGSAAVTVVDALEHVPAGHADYLFAFEVLEHIEDDEAALSSWAERLREGGTLLLTVPAHPSKFGPSDVRVGHVRRYEKQPLCELVARCGFADIEIVSYGFPLGNLGSMVGNLLERRIQRHDDLSAVQRSIASGVEQSRPVRTINRLIRLIIAPFLVMQRLAFHTDLGDGYVLRATRERG